MSSNPLRQVAIAPKPPGLISGAQALRLPAGQQFAIAPKPVAVLPKGPSLVKKVSVAGVIQSATKPTNTLLSEYQSQRASLLHWFIASDIYINNTRCYLKQLNSLKIIGIFRLAIQLRRKPRPFLLASRISDYELDENKIAKVIWFIL